MTKELEAIRAIDKIHDALVAKGVVIPDAYKRRDPKEPGREEKELAELKLEKLLKRLFKAQKKQIREWLEIRYFDRKQEKPDLPDDDILNDPIIQALIAALFVLAINGGIDIANIESGEVIDVLVAHAIALDFVAFSHAEWLAGLNETTRNVLQSALEMFRDVPGTTIGDVMDALSGVFDESRVKRIAITEITRMYGKGEQIVGEQLAKDFPDVRVIKTWFTNNDGLVCDICRPLNGVSVKIKDTFTGGLGGEHLHPPAHVNCRCWMSVRTDITKSVELQ